MRLKQILIAIFLIALMIGSLPFAFAAAPTAVADSKNVVTAKATIIDVMANDSDADTDSFTVTAVSTPTNGAAVVNAGGASVTYTSNAAFTGTDSFTYTITDTNSDSATATVTVTVHPASTLSITNQVLFDNAERDTVLTSTVTITNTGNVDEITGIAANLANVGTKYSATITGTVPTNLAAGASATFNVQLTIPEDEDTGNVKVGDLTVTGTDGTNTLDQIVDVRINPKNFLEIKDIEINGKSNGDLTVEDENEIEVEIKNNHNKDFDDVEVTVTILDVDGDDIDEEQEVDINDNDSEKITFTFDLSNEDVDEDEYTIEVRVEGEDDNGAMHTLVETFTVDVDREKHRVVLRKTTLDRTSVSCSENSVNMFVRVENIGKSNEDDVEIRVSNERLGLDMKKTNIELEDFQDKDNDYQTNFPIDLRDAESGEYAIRVEVYRDGDIEERKDVTLTVSCGSSSGTKVVSGRDELSEELEKGLEARRIALEENSSIRDNDSYIVLLGILAILAFVAVVLALAVVFVKRK